MTMEVCEEIDKALEATICKNLFLCNRQETNFYLLMLLMDKELVQDEYVGCHPCINTSSLRLKMDDLLHVLLPAMHHEPIFVTVEDEESQIR